MVYCREHPFANSGGYVPEHRLVLEKKLSIIINPKTHDVHHRNEIRDDNRLSNLQLLTKSEHKRIHAGWELKKDGWYKPCRTCKKKIHTDNFYTRKTGRCGKYTNDCKACSVKIGESRNVNKTFVCACGKSMFLKTRRYPDTPFLCPRCIVIRNWERRRANA